MPTHVNLIHILQEDHTKRVKEVMPPPQGMKQRMRWKYSLIHEEYLPNTNRIDEGVREIHGPQ